MTEARVAGAKPSLHRFSKKGESILWCACGRSARQPYCDGSHKATGFSPLRLTAARDDEEVLLCVCKRTKNPPYCDGSHNALGVYGADDGGFDWAGASLVMHADGDNGRASLDGDCYVLTPDMTRCETIGGWRVLSTISRRDGADKLSQFLIESEARETEPLSFGEAEVVLFVIRGEGSIVIGHTSFDARSRVAFSIRPGEAFAARNAGSEPVRLIATVCPPEPPRIAAPMTFDKRFPLRACAADQSKLEAMGDRFYQVLTKADAGADQITQFIGSIPKSRAAPHRHLYEETLYILAGEGVMWTQSRKAIVRAGDVVYLPPKQLHSLECTSPEDIILTGSFYPAGSPAINY